MDRKTLERALARYHLQQKEAIPTAKAAYEALLAGSDLPEIPEADEVPDRYPYKALPTHEAHQLAFICNATPDKAAELEGLWLLVAST